MEVSLVEEAKEDDGEGAGEVEEADEETFQDVLIVGDGRDDFRLAVFDVVIWRTTENHIDDTTNRHGIEEKREKKP